MKLIIRHLPESADPDDSFRFQVLLGDEAAEPVEVRSAKGYPVEGHPQDELMSELRWYLEKFLEYPYSPETEHAERVLAALRGWASEAFMSLFGAGDGAAMFERAAADGYEQLRIQLQSDDPRVLSWPWETLRHPQDGPLGLKCHMERSVSGLPELEPLTVELPRDRVNILMVTARPYPQDVGYRSISRPLVEMVDHEDLPVEVHVLRPPTFGRLEEHLAERPGYYHVLHFDGHGAYRPSSDPSAGALGGQQSQALDAQQLKGYEGCLVFEDEIGADVPVSAVELSELLCRYDVPVVVLNACQSGMLDDAAATAFASVAVSLLRGRTQSVVAMAYSLYVSAAQEFLPDFYRGLLSSGDLGMGMRVGRGGMAKRCGRVCARGRFDLEDWLVPVIYQRDGVNLPFGVTARSALSKPVLKLKNVEQTAGSFVGRDGAILQLERAMQQQSAGILIYGLAGVGKTALARGFVEWLARTEGLGSSCFWQDFQDAQKVDCIWEQLGQQFVGSQLSALNAKHKIVDLPRLLRDESHLIIWDNFETLSGKISSEDFIYMSNFLKMLRGGKTKIIITSCENICLIESELQKVEIGGFLGEERWAYCADIIENLGVEVSREDEDFQALMECLSGHPLMIKTVMPELGRRSPRELVKALRSGLPPFGLENAGIEALHVKLCLVDEKLDDQMRKLLVPLALHERFVSIDFLKMMSRKYQGGALEGKIDEFVCILSEAGFLRDLGATFEMHPMLGGLLRSTRHQSDPAAQDLWARIFIAFYSGSANHLVSRPDHLVPRPLIGQQFAIHMHRANFLSALEKAQEMGLADSSAAIVQALAVFSMNRRDFPKAAEHYHSLIDLRAQNDPGKAAVYYHQLGAIAHENGDLDSAEEWYMKSLSIKENLENNLGMAATYHQLGTLAHERHDLERAENLYLKSVKIKEAHGDKRGAAATYNNLGAAACDRRDFDVARDWYLRSAELKEEADDRHGSAITYHHLGVVEQERRDFAAAEKWLKLSLEIRLKDGDEAGVAETLHQLGRVAEERGEFVSAEDLYLRSLKISERLGDRKRIGATCNQLGTIAQNRREFEAAERWYQRSLEAALMLDDKKSVATSYHQLGRLAEDRRDFVCAKNWYLKSLEIRNMLYREYDIATTYHQLGRVSQECEDFDAAEDCYLKSLEIFENQKEMRSIAIAYHQLGFLAQKRRNFSDARDWLLKAAEVKRNLDDECSLAVTYHQLGVVSGLEEDYGQSGEWFVKSLVIFIRVNDSDHIHQASRNFGLLYRQAPPLERASLRALWEDAGFPWPEGIEDQ